MRDYTDLEREVRAVIPADKYGYLDYFLSDDHGIYRENSGSLKISGDFSFDLGYNCFDANWCLFDLLVERGEAPKFYTGDDEKRFFARHYFCSDDEGVILDAVSLFPFSGARHMKNYAYVPKNNVSLHVTNPLTVGNVEGKKYVIGLGATHVENGDTLKLISNVSHQGVVDQQIFRMSIDLNNYRDLFPRNFSGYKNPKQGREGFEFLERRDFFNMEVSSIYSNFDFGVSNAFDAYKYALLAVIHKIAYRADFQNEILRLN